MQRLLRPPGNPQLALQGCTCCSGRSGVLSAHLSCATVGTWPGMTPKSPVVAGISTRSTCSGATTASRSLSNQRVRQPCKT